MTAYLLLLTSLTYTRCAVIGYNTKHPMVGFCFVVLAFLCGVYGLEALT